MPIAFPRKRSRFRWLGGRGASGGRYGEMLPYFIKSECNERGDPRYHGHLGPLAVQDGRSMHPLVDHLLEAGARYGYRPTDDFNAASQMGVGRFQLTQRNGVGAVPPPLISTLLANGRIYTCSPTTLCCGCTGRVSARPVSRFIVTAGSKPYWPKEKSSSRPRLWLAPDPDVVRCGVGGGTGPLRYSCSRRSSGWNQSSGPSPPADELSHRREIALWRWLARRRGPLPARPRPLDLKHRRGWRVPVNARR